MNLPVIMHITYCEQGQTVQDACQKAVEWGFDGIEFRSRNIKYKNGVESFDAGVESYMDQIYKGVMKSGLKTVILGYPGADLMSPDPEVRETEIKNFINCCMLAIQRFPLNLCNTFSGSLMNPDTGIDERNYGMHGSAAADDLHWKWAAEGFKKIAGFAERANIKLAFETHPNYIHDTPEAALKLVDMIDSKCIGVNLDYGNIIEFNNPPTMQDTVKLIGNKLFYVHLKNSVGVDGIRFKCALSDGDINNREFLSTLIKSGYTGPLCIEAPRNGDREWYAKQDISYLKSLLKDL
jgi:3-dehydroshikimate dehydratase